MFVMENFKKVMNAIRANPEAWCQDAWHGVRVPDGTNLNTVFYHPERPNDPAFEPLYAGLVGVGPHNNPALVRTVFKGECGTVHCIAGWAQILAGHDQNIKTVKEEAGEWLGLNQYHWGVPWLFRPDRTWQNLLDVEAGIRDPNCGIMFTGYNAGPI